AAVSTAPTLSAEPATEREAKATPSRASGPRQAFTPPPQRASAADEPFADTIYRVPRRNPWPLVGALGGLVAIGAVVVLMATRSGPGTTGLETQPAPVETPAAATTAAANPPREKPVEPPAPTPVPTTPDKPVAVKLAIHST